ncbi:hypothetical protein N7366_14745 [Aeromonas caviae]|uniref:hypothetical protein n=1 Tax=Aeromonas caviae TaxID=648 RepID=UPI00244A8A62|nr:hypothetical protein [Aeromonas caviae]MDH0434481.1 hypothetical protein [Aeromonas caviae]MDH0937329.1 hypothetical protein [Aeromonas caviae]MDH1398139.1 hypothetical protein [Aeromonas caviae]MDH1805303.1 hypothetical protein [Aeromonas caviae]
MIIDQEYINHPNTPFLSRYMPVRVNTASCIITKLDDLANHGREKFEIARKIRFKSNYYTKNQLKNGALGRRVASKPFRQPQPASSARTLSRSA